MSTRAPVGEPRHTQPTVESKALDTELQVRIEAALAKTGHGQGNLSLDTRLANLQRSVPRCVTGCRCENMARWRLLAQRVLGELGV